LQTAISKPILNHSAYNPDPYIIHVIYTHKRAIIHVIYTHKRAAPLNWIHVIYTHKRAAPLNWNSGLKMRRMKDPPQLTNALASAPLYTQNFFSIPNFVFLSKPGLNLWPSKHKAKVQPLCKFTFCDNHYNLMTILSLTIHNYITKTK